MTAARADADFASLPGPAAIAATPDGQRLFLTHPNTARSASSITQAGRRSRVSLPRRAVRHCLRCGRKSPAGYRLEPRPSFEPRSGERQGSSRSPYRALAGAHRRWTLDHRRIFVCEREGNDVGVYDSRTLAAIKHIHVGTAPYAIAYAPATKRVYVANVRSNNVSVIDAEQSERHRLHSRRADALWRGSHARRQNTARHDPGEKHAYDARRGKLEEARRDQSRPLPGRCRRQARTAQSPMSRTGFPTRSRSSISRMARRRARLRSQPARAISSSCRELIFGSPPAVTAVAPRCGSPAKIADRARSRRHPHRVMALNWVRQGMADERMRPSGVRPVLIAFAMSAVVQAPSPVVLIRRDIGRKKATEVAGNRMIARLTSAEIRQPRHRACAAYGSRCSR